MIEPQTVNPLKLPSVPLGNRKELYRGTGIYFVIQDEKDVLYIGRSFMIKRRWTCQHPVFRRLNDEDIQNSRIHWLAIDSNENLQLVESFFIHHFRPPLNMHYPTFMKVRKVLEKEVSGLGAKIKQAREADKRSLIQICATAGITPAIWCKIEFEEIKILPFETLCKIECALGMSFDVSFDEEDQSDN